MGSRIGLYNSKPLNPKPTLVQSLSGGLVAMFPHLGRESASAGGSACESYWQPTGDLGALGAQRVALAGGGELHALLPALLQTPETGSSPHEDIWALLP